MAVGNCCAMTGTWKAKSVCSLQFHHSQLTLLPSPKKLKGTPMSTLQTTFPDAMTIDELVDFVGENSISMIMPTYRAGRQVKQNAIRFKNLLSTVVVKLVEQGESEHAANHRLRSLFNLAREDEFWQHQSSGLAVYLTDDGRITAIALCEEPPELAIVSTHFYLVPVVLEAAGNKDYRVLTLSWEEARLYSANRSHVRAVENRQFPVVLRDVILPPDTEDQLQFRTQGQGNGLRSTMFHGQGKGEGMIESDRKRFLAEVGRRLNNLLEQPPLSLILVGTAEVQGEFLSESNFEPLYRILTSPDGLNEQELFQRVLSVVNEDDSTQASERLVEQLGTALAAGRGSRDLEKIVEAAAEGRVQTLLVSRKLKTDGQELGEKECPPANLAVIRTLQTDGNIIAVSSDVLDTADVAAIYRF